MTTSTLTPEQQQSIVVHFVGPTGATCSNSCRHECGECRLGLGTHLPCDPRCTQHPGGAR